MDIKKLIMGVIALSLGAVMIAGALLPAVSSAIDGTHEIYNNSSATYATSTDPATIVYDNGEYFVNDVKVELDSSTRILFLSDVLNIETSQNGSFIMGYSEGSLIRDTWPEFTATITAENIDLSLTSADNEITNLSIPISWGYYVSNDGPYRAYTVYSDGPEIYINDISQIVAIGRDTSNVWSVNGNMAILNGVQTGNIEYTSTEEPLVNDVFSILVTNDINTTGLYFKNSDQSLAFNTVIVPYEIVGHKKGYEGIESLFNALPLVAISGLVMAGIYVFISRK